MKFNPVVFFIGRSVAAFQGVPAAEANKLGLLGAMLRPPVMGIVLASAVARNEAASTRSTVIVPALQLTAVTGSSSVINVFWNSFPGAATYTLTHGSKSGGKKTIAVDDLPDLSFSETGLGPDTTVFYQLEAFDSEGETLAVSREVSATTDSSD
jgi:hypothetical protein